jgi:hypothetical protein
MNTISLNYASLFIFTACQLISPSLWAEAVYKSVDKNGKITYSSSPTKNHSNTIKVNILPPPSTADIEAAQQRHQQNLKNEKTINENRQKRSQALAEKKRLQREKKLQAEIDQIPKKPKEQGPYYGLPGHGILVLPQGGLINP